MSLSWIGILDWFLNLWFSEHCSSRSWIWETANCEEERQARKGKRRSWDTTLFQRAGLSWHQLVSQKYLYFKDTFVPLHIDQPLVQTAYRRGHDLEQSMPRLIAGTGERLSHEPSVSHPPSTGESVPLSWKGRILVVLSIPCSPFFTLHFF